MADSGGSSVGRNTSETTGNSRYTRSLGFEANIKPKQNTVLYTTSTGNDWKIGSSTPDERRKHQTASDRGARPVGQEAIEEIPFHRMKFQSYLFPLKQHGKVRAILDCSELNKHITYNHFNGGTSIYTTHDTQDDWLIKVDLKYVYLHLPLHTQDRPLVAFKWKEKTYQFRVLPFGSLMHRDYSQW